MEPSTTGFATDQIFQPNTRWLIPQRLRAMAVVGREAVAVAHDVFIMFLDLVKGGEVVLTVAGVGRGPGDADGVDVIAGNPKANMFAFAEKVENPRLFMMSYPLFDILAEFKGEGHKLTPGAAALAGGPLRVDACYDDISWIPTETGFLAYHAAGLDTEVNRYKGLCFMENDMLAALGGFPDYRVSVWSWRSNQRLMSVASGVACREQLLVASRTHLTVCQCWSGGLVLWEVAPAHRRHFVLRRAYDAPRTWHRDPPLTDVCFTNDGQIYAINSEGQIFSMSPEGMGLGRYAEWSPPERAQPDQSDSPDQSDQPDQRPESGDAIPLLCSFGVGLLVYCPDRCLRLLKKEEADAGGERVVRWCAVWQYRPPSDVDRLVGGAGAGGDLAVLWTAAGHVLRVLPSAAPNVAPSAATNAAPDVTLLAYKHRHIKEVELISPDYKYIAILNDSGVICVYERDTASMVEMKFMDAEEVIISASFSDPLLAVVGRQRASGKYGLRLLQCEREGGTLSPLSSHCLTHQRVSRVTFSPSGRHLLAAALDAGQVFLYTVGADYKLSLLRYVDVGRGLAYCNFSMVGDAMRVFMLVLFSDKYRIGERILCVNAETGKDNKVAGKMQGPYSQLLGLAVKDTLIAVPHRSRTAHLFKLSGHKGTTIIVKIGQIAELGHELKSYSVHWRHELLLSYGADGGLILRRADSEDLATPPELKMVAAHRYEGGVKLALVGGSSSAECLVHLAHSGVLGVTVLEGGGGEGEGGEGGGGRGGRKPPPPPLLPDRALSQLQVIAPTDLSYLELEELKKVHEEAMEVRSTRLRLLEQFAALQVQLVELLEENVAERPLHQLSLSEFNLHQENKRMRLQQAGTERELIRLHAEARIRGQDKITALIKKTCWDTMAVQRTKLFAIFSHYQVENYPVLPSERDTWAELEQAEALRALEAELDDDLLEPWLPERVVDIKPSIMESKMIRGDSLSVGSTLAPLEQESEELPASRRYVLSGSGAHHFITIPTCHIPQNLAFSYLQMNWLHHIVKLNVQRMRQWFNKQFDELMALKKREMGLVEERNTRLRFIVEELNKLSDLRNSFHHLIIRIVDPVWKQEEQPERLIKVDPAECSIEPYVSPSQVVIPPPEPKPKDDFKERALNEMMDGVLEKLWHEEIKKPIPKPQCMLDKDPEHFNEEDLRVVFEYEAKVAFREEERSKYRKMLHAEYSRLSLVLNENIVKFNMRVKDMWLVRLKVDSVIGQENLNLMRLRRINLDRLEADEEIEDIRQQSVVVEAQLEQLSRESAEISAQVAGCTSAYEALAVRDRQLERAFKGQLAELAAIVAEQCYKLYKKRPKWHQRASMIPGVLYELAANVASGIRSSLLHPDCHDYFRGVDQLDNMTNMPAVLDEQLWLNMCRMRRVKIESEIKMRAVVQELGTAQATGAAWLRAQSVRRAVLAAGAARLAAARARLRDQALNRTMQLVMPAGQVEVQTSGHIADFDNAALIPRSDIDAINDLILKVGAIKLRMMKRQIELRKSILGKEWEHAQLCMKLRHMREELYSYSRIKIGKELQWFLKNKEKGATDEQDYLCLEKEMAATRASIDHVLRAQAQASEDMEMKIYGIMEGTARLESLITKLTLLVSERRLAEDPLQAVRVRRELQRRLMTVVSRAEVVREVQALHARLVLLQTQLELLRIRTYPTLAPYAALC